MKAGFRYVVLLACLAGYPAHADWKAVETVETYAIEGSTGAELYESIGERGPKLGGLSRVVAHTTFRLTWTRKYEPQGQACVLVTARPKLTIIYTVPKPSARLGVTTAKSWDDFITGVVEHEKIHGDFIKAMVADIEKVSVGLRVEGDPACKKIRTELTRRLGIISGVQRQRSRTFDQTEMQQGGNIYQLVLNLIEDR